MTLEDYRDLQEEILSDDFVDDFTLQDDKFNSEQIQGLRDIGYLTFEEWESVDDFEKKVVKGDVGKNTATWSDRRKLGKFGEDKFLIHAARRSDTVAIKDVRENPDYFIPDIDFLWYVNRTGNLFSNGFDVSDFDQGKLEIMLAAEDEGRKVDVEIKTQVGGLSWKIPSFVMQVQGKGSIEGWAYRTEADILLIYDLPRRQFHSFNVPPLQSYLRWLQGKVEDNNGYMGSNMFTKRGTTCLTVPKVLVEDLNRHQLDYSCFEEL